MKTMILYYGVFTLLLCIGSTCFNYLLQDRVFQKHRYGYKQAMEYTINLMTDKEDARIRFEEMIQALNLNFILRDVEADFYPRSLKVRGDVKLEKERLVTFEDVMIEVEDTIQSAQ